jgi:hypothetical protein
MQKGLLRRRLPGAAVPAYVALDLCYISRLKLWFLAGRCAHALRNFPCGKIAACWQFVILSPYSGPLKSLDYSMWAPCRQMAMLQLVQKSALCSVPFYNCGWRDDGAAKLPLAQAAPGKGHCHWQQL